MKKYTHAWLAFMAIKRIENLKFPNSDKGKVTAENAKNLVDWFKNYRDFVIQGSWYPNVVFDDRASSHVAKYEPAERVGDKSPFGALPQTMQVADKMKKISKLYNEKGFRFVKGNLSDRCNAMYHTIIDNFKIQFKEDKGNPLSPSSNHLAMRFFMMSHYIADGHMPMHCDARNLRRIEDCLGSAWECEVRKSYLVDLPNQRFFYDKYGYPKKKGSKATSLIEKIEKNIDGRKYIETFGSGNDNLYDYMRVVTQYSYLMSYELFPAKLEDMGWRDYKKTELFKKYYEDYSEKILSDTIESIAHAWLAVWNDFYDWNPVKEYEKTKVKIAIPETDDDIDEEGGSNTKKKKTTKK